MKTQFTADDRCIFGTTKSAYRDFNGEEVAILAVIEGDNGIPMYKIMFSTGTEAEVYGNELTPCSSITLIVYDFHKGRIIMNRYPIVRETSKIYHTEDYRFYKDRLNAPYTYCFSGKTYLKIELLNTTEALAIEKLSDWFTHMSNSVFASPVKYNEGYDSE